MTSREYKYHDIKCIKRRFKRIGCGFRSHAYPSRIKPISLSEIRSGIAYLIPNGAITNADGTYPILDPEFLKPRKWVTS